jgi:CelD/BcsL family acetyltransferase involved in cellulose biosynthesis
MKVRIIQDNKGFEELGYKWNDMTRHCNQFTLYKWLYLWWKNYGEDKKLRIYVVEDDEDIVVILPLMLISQNGITTLTQLGLNGSDFYRYIGSDNSEALALIFRTIIEKEKYDRFCLSNLRTDDKNTETLVKTAITVFNNLDIVKQGQSFVVDTRLPYEDYYRNRSKNYKHKMRQIAQNSSKYEFYVCKDYSEEIINEIVELHRKRWIRHMQLSVFYDYRRESFLHSVCREFAQMGLLRLFVLKDTSGIKAYRLGFLHNGIYHDWNTAFDLECSKDSVGILLCEKVIRYCCSNDINEVDFLRGEEDYKERFATNAHAYITVEFKRIKELEDYLYRPPIVNVMEKLNKIKSVIVVLKKLCSYGKDEIIDLGKTLDGFTRAGLKVQCVAENIRQSELVPNEISSNGRITIEDLEFSGESGRDIRSLFYIDDHTLVLGDSLPLILSVNNNIGVTCLYINDLIIKENKILISEKPDMVIDRFSRLLEQIDN